MDKIELEPIGYAFTETDHVPRHWSVSDVEGVLKINSEYAGGLKDIEKGQKIVVIFHFHKSGPFDPGLLSQTPPHRNAPLGVFSICSPRRPNPIGLSVLEVLGIKGSEIRVKGVDMLNHTPILDIKPFITGIEDCPSAP